MKFGNINSEINGTWVTVHDSGELESSVSSYTIENLRGDTDIEYQLICRFIDDSTVGDYKLTFNTDTSANYGYQDMKGVSTTKSATRDTSEAYWHIGQTATDDNLCFSNTHIFAKSGKERTGLTTYAYDINGTTVTGIVKRASVWDNTADEITQMVITASADNINIGSRIILLKKVHNDAMKTGVITPNKIEGAWERIYSSTITAGNAGNEVNIVGLKGDTDQVYRLVARFKNDDATPNLYSLRFNSDTGSNYGKQALGAENTAVIANRFTSHTSFLLFTITCLDQNFLSLFDSLLYAKSGYERTMLSEHSEDVNGTTINSIAINGRSWSNTADEITSIVISSSQPYGLGVGTNIELYRLNLS